MPARFSNTSRQHQAYEHWRLHFIDNRKGSDSLPWNAPGHLLPEEAGIVRRAIQQFQLGEYARGRGLTLRASSCRFLTSDPSFLPALKMFIAEEQNHSEMLGRFLDREGLPRLKRHWVDGIFRRIRKLAGMEICVTTLVTAEVFAIPFYQALRDATRSPLLRAICARILCDEAAHLNFQGLTIGLVRRPLGKIARRIHTLGHVVLFRCAGLILWQQHRAMFRASGWNFERFWSNSCRIFAKLNREILRVSHGNGVLHSFEEFRLD